MVNINNQRNENLGPAERIINTLLTHQDHLYHGRPGVVTPSTVPGALPDWKFVTHKVEGDKKVVYELKKVGKKTTRVKLGVMTEAVNPNGIKVLVRTDNSPNHPIVGEYREPGLFPEIVDWMYEQIASVYKLDNEFCARWASYAWGQDHRDFKTVIAAFMLVQSRKGDPIVDGGKVEFFDDDYRDIGEAMMLVHDKDKGLSPKLLLRIYDVLTLPQIAERNRQLGFAVSQRKPFLGRWPKVVEKWLRHREDNPRLLDGLVKAGFRTTVIRLAQLVHYKPETPRFFKILRWGQKQSATGHRQMLNVELDAAQSWAGLTEVQICERIVKEKPNWKRIVGLLPSEIGVTRAIVAATIQANALSDKDLVILTPTLEELGLLDIADIKARWDKALKAATDMRAMHIKLNVKSEKVKEQLQAASDTAVQKAVEEITRGLRIYFMIDTSGSMQGAIERAKEYIAKFLQGFPPDRIHISTFTTTGKELTLKLNAEGKASAASVENAFRGITAGGGTEYGQGVLVLQKHKPKADEDAIFFFVGDEEAPPFDTAVRASGLNPIAFALLKVLANHGAAGWRAAQYGGDNNTAVRETARRLNIPCFMIDDKTFDDVYAIPRTIRNLIAATPVVARIDTPTYKRVTLVDQILATELLKKPIWA